MAPGATSFPNHPHKRLQQCLLTSISCLCRLLFPTVPTSLVPHKRLVRIMLKITWLSQGPDVNLYNTNFKPLRMSSLCIFCPHIFFFHEIVVLASWIINLFPPTIAGIWMAGRVEIEFLDVITHPFCCIVTLRNKVTLNCSMPIRDQSDKSLLTD